MNTKSIIGVVLIVLGVVGLVYGGVTYTTQSNVIDAGDLQLQVDQTRQIPFPPLVGAAAVTLGVILMYVGRRKPVHA